MDEFAKEYFQKLKVLTHDFEGRRLELAKSRIKMFAAAITRQLLEFDETFDLLIGAGNSGLYMTKITEMTYQYLNAAVPKILNIPIVRFKEDGKILNDNSFLLPEVKQILGKINAIKNVLFVDDEIMRAITAKECFELLLKANQNISHFDATIVAEHHFFEWHYKLPKVSIRFFAYSPLIQYLNANISYFIPEDLYQEISKYTKGISSHNEIMAIVIGGAVKRIKQQPFYDSSIEKVLQEKIPNYEERKAILTKSLQKLVKEGVDEYRTGKITFRF
ncbi:MAG: phosphoribosyltransferase [Candidatus Levybacteria bacterium]|nr:phosphoribosyltransferase [Candidatus Levybacteria bacterium]